VLLLCWPKQRVELVVGHGGTNLRKVIGGVRRGQVKAAKVIQASAAALLRTERQRERA